MKRAGLMHNKNYETNPRGAARKREDAVSGVALAPANAKKQARFYYQNEPNVGQALSGLWKP
jgi:hypothetical protein